MNKQNEITIADTVELFQFVHKLTTKYKGYSWDFISIELAEFVEFSSQCYIDIDYEVVIKNDTDTDYKYFTLEIN